MPFGTDPAEYFKQFTGEPEVPASIVAPEATPAQQPTQTPWYNNPGFWSKVGGIGSALVGAKTPLGQAAQYASQYHNAQQLDATTRKVMANAAAGTDPMTGIGTSETMGLMPDQITALNKEGVARQSALAEEERKGRVAESTIDYQKTIADQIKEKMEKEKTLESNFTTTMDLVINGSIKNKYVDADTAQVLKGLGLKEGGEIYAKIVAAKSKDPKINTYADVHDGKLYILKDGAVADTISIGKKPVTEKTPGEQIGFVKEHRNLAIADFYPQLKEEFLKGSSDPAMAKQFDDLYTMVDAKTGEQVGLNKLYGMASPELKRNIMLRLDEYNNKPGGYGDIPPIGAKIPKPTPTPVASDKEVKKYGEWMLQNESAIVSKLKGKPAGPYQFPNGAWVEWDGNSGITISTPVTKKK